MKLPFTKKIRIPNIGASKDEVEELEKNGVTICNDLINISFIHNSDLKALGACSDLLDDDCICPFCSCTTKERFNIRDRSFFNSKKRNVKDLFGMKRHMICCLHCKQRITEYYIKHMVKGDEILMEKLQEAARKIHGLGNFKIVEKKSKWEDNIISYSVRILKGDECDLIIQNYKIFIEVGECMVSIQKNSE